MDRLKCDLWVNKSANQERQGSLKLMCREWLFRLFLGKGRHRHQMEYVQYFFQLSGLIIADFARVFKKVTG